MPNPQNRPILALTMGDPVGVGPEILALALAQPEIYQVCRPLILGDLPALERARQQLTPQLQIRVVERPEDGHYQGGTLDLLALSNLNAADLAYGRPTPAGGAAMASYIITAIDLAMQQQVAGLVTGPISKIALQLAGYSFPGHTELLAARTHTPEVAMMLAGGEFRVVLATIHCALAEVPRRLNSEGIYRLLRLTGSFLKEDLGLADPSLAVCALNPHAGEGGMFGHEEEEIILPAIRRAQEEGLPVAGPFPADTLFWRHYQGEFAAVAAMYHDQGLIPLKLLHFMDAVNITLGLPIIRTSVDHGTAYDLAGTGKAHPGSLLAAIELAAALARRKFGR
jgi:4-hydroxythreonine-4-phosphate dehydrogenase